MAALPFHRIDAAGDSWTADRPLVTSGAYRLATWRLNDYAQLTRNPNWLGPSKLVPEIIWRPMEDALSAMRLMLAGGADTVADYPAARHAWLLQHHRELVHATPYLGSYYFVFNTRVKPFDDVRVRTALAMTIEQRWIAEKLFGTGLLPAWGFLPPGIDDAQPYQPVWQDWSRARRLAQAAQMLRSAGYGPSRPLRFEIRFNSSAEHRRVAVALAAMWRPLGVEVSLFNSEAALHFAALRQHQFQLARSGWIADLPISENFLAVHRMSNGAGNYSGYSSPAYDSALDRALSLADPKQRATAMRQAEKLIMQDMPILPIYYYATRNLVAPRISVWRDNVSNVHPSRTLRIVAP
ncbi:MAG: peptide ABC transporter substrate-binding protein [Parasphingorhabdus sp.]|nr:peptide ABC transporter substrate-binding protein [Parasphingorhabdus sp.]